MAEMTYDEAMLRLETIVSKLESGDISIEQALKEYEDGVRLVEFCENYLSGKEKLFSSLKSKKSEVDTDE